MTITLTCDNCGAKTEGPTVDVSAVPPFLRAMLLGAAETMMPPCAVCGGERSLTESEAEPPVTEEPRPRRKVGPEAGQ